MEIKFLQINSFSPDIISKKLEIPIETICDILEYPKDVEGRVRAHQEYNFNYHGKDENIIFDRFEQYGFYLKEGDFEKWQQVCYMDKDGDEFNRLKEEAERIPKSNDPESEARRYWILMRFPIYQEDEWKMLRDKHSFHIKKISGFPFEKREFGRWRLPHLSKEEIFKR